MMMLFWWWRRPRWWWRRGWKRVRAAALYDGGQCQANWYNGPRRKGLKTPETLQPTRGQTRNTFFPGEGQHYHYIRKIMGIWKSRGHPEIPDNHDIWKKTGRPKFGGNQKFRKIMIFEKNVTFEKCGGTWKSRLKIQIQKHIQVHLQNRSQINIRGQIKIIILNSISKIILEIILKSIFKISS